MYVLLLTTSLIGCVIAAPLVIIDTLLDNQWTKFKLDHNKYYSSQEDALRKRIWSDHKIDIEAHDVEADMEWSSFHMKLNQFTDRTVQEIRGYTHTGTDVPVDVGAEVYTPTGTQLPASVDWRLQGGVTPVVNQFACGADWAIAVTGVIEAQLKNKTGKLTALSVQDVIDCSSGNSGCMGGWADLAFRDILSAHAGGVERETCSPYEAKKNYCQHNVSCEAATVLSYKMIPSGDEGALLDAVATVGPVAASISVGSGFLSYSSGVYDNAECLGEVSRSVLVVGYGTEAGQDYWLVKNSFGEDWGDRGYIKMARNRGNQCGIATRASVALMA